MKSMNENIENVSECDVTHYHKNYSERSKKVNISDSFRLCENYFFCHLNTSDKNIFSRKSERTPTYLDYTHQKTKVKNFEALKRTVPSETVLFAVCDIINNRNTA